MNAIRTDWRTAPIDERDRAMLSYADKLTRDATSVTDCAAPREQLLHGSASDDAATHGKKLYYLFARQLGAYSARRHPPAPVGQVIVKESWKPVPVPAAELAKRGEIATAMLGREHYRTGERLGLFMMLKLDPATEGTDEGWVYGVVSGDGKRVLSAGRVESCVRCHSSAPGDRLFGPPL